jgi:hypothetical protein
LDLASNRLVSTTNCGGYRVATFSPDGTIVASIHVASGENSFVKIWSTDSRYLNPEMVNNRFQGVSTYFFRIAPDGQLMISESFGEFKIWDTTSGESVFTFDFTTYIDFEFILSTTFSPDAAFVACLARFGSSSFGSADFGSAEKQAYVFNVQTRSLVNTMVLDRDSYHIALSPGGKRLVSLSNSHITLWGVRSGKPLANICYSSSLWRISKPQIAFALDGTRVFIKSDDGEIHGWRLSLVRSVLRLVQLEEKELLNQDMSNVFGPRPCCRYQNRDEWIFDEDGKRIFWIPLDRRSFSSNFHGRTVIMRTDKGRVYVADFSGAQLYT